MIQKTYIFKIVVVKINSFKVKEYNSKKSICVPSDWLRCMFSEISNNYLSRKDVTLPISIIMLHSHVGKKVDLPQIEPNSHTPQFYKMKH